MDAQTPNILQKAKQAGPINDIFPLLCLLLVVILEAVVAIWAVILHDTLPKRFNFVDIESRTPSCPISSLHNGLLVVAIITVIIVLVQIFANIVKLIADCLKGCGIRRGEDADVAGGLGAKILTQISSVSSCAILVLFLVGFGYVVSVFQSHNKCGNAGEIDVKDFVHAWATTALVLSIVDLVLILCTCVCVCVCMLCLVGVFGVFLAAKAREAGAQEMWDGSRDPHDDELFDDGEDGDDDFGHSAVPTQNIQLTRGPVAGGEF